MRAVLWLNSNGPSTDIQRSVISGADLIVGVDGGSDRAQRAGFQVDLILGDLDSTEISHEGIERIQLESQESSDLSKAIRYLCKKGYDEMDVIGIEGGCEGHQLGIWGSVAEAPDEVTIRLHSSQTVSYRVAPGSVDFLIKIEPGKRFSVFALEPCESVTLKGGKWSIEDEFFSLSTRGLHNVSESSLLRVSTDGNMIVVVHR